MPLFSRRKLFISSVALTASAGLYGAFKWLTGGPEDIVIAILHRRVGHFKIDAKVFSEFTKDYLTSKKGARKQLKILSVLSDPLEYVSPYRLLPFSNPYRRLEDNVVSQFLLSTDFFQQGASIDNNINYLGFYDPLHAICRNPLMKHIEFG